MSKTLIVPGRKISTPGGPDERLSRFLSVDTKHAVEIDATRRGETQETHEVSGIEASDVVEIELADGVKYWTSVESLEETLTRLTPEAVADRGVLQIPAALPTGRTRGMGDWILKGLKFFGVDPVNEFAGVAVATAIEKIEDRLEVESGLYRMTPSGEMGDYLEPGNLSDSGEPYLVFVHGTGSYTRGSFSDLYDTEQWRDLHRRYPDRVLALEHRTLSQSPATNALDLARRLPSNARLHLVTYSRGGLIGELLCRERFDDDDLRLLRKKGRDRDVATLRQLSEQLQAKHFQIERFARVACPARGTTLASGRLDLFLSVLLNALGMIPLFKQEPLASIYDFLKAVLLEIASRRANVDEVPGIEAQMPESPFIHMLNRTGVKTPADLGVIAGDIQGAGIFHRLAVLATDLFYLQQHDLVVNTSSMDGGVQRETPGSRAFDRGADVHHFSYFSRDDSRRDLHAWLTRQDDQPAEGFTEIEPPKAAPRRRDLAASLPADRPLLFFLPDLMASHLQVGDQPIWLDVESLSLGRFSQLVMGENDVDASGIVAAAYEQMLDRLEPLYQVMPFAFDWRKSIAVEGPRLAAEIREAWESEEETRPIHFLAHGMGGLVMRYALAADEQLWPDIRRRHGRLLMLGTPNHGSDWVLRLLCGQGRLLRMLALLDGGLTEEELLRIFCDWPGLLDLLPREAQAKDWWVRAGLPVQPAPEMLAEARKIREKLEQVTNFDGWLYVAGMAPATWAIDRAGDNVESCRRTAQGDGRDTHELGGLEGMRTWYLNAAHGDLPARLDPSTVRDLLERGDTAELSSSLPTVEDRLPSEPEETPTLFPSATQFEAEALGLAARAEDMAEMHELTVSVAHGNLIHAQQPVAVGHYEGDLIWGAEGVLDRRLDLRLSERHRLNLYPGKVGEVEVLLVDRKPAGALVIGLGQVGRLNAQRLTRGVTNAALRYALLAQESQDENTAEGGALKIGLSSVLIGTTKGQSLSLNSSLAAIVRGVLRANRILRERKLADGAGRADSQKAVQIDSVQFVERYWDRVTDAVFAVRSLSRTLSAELAADELIKPEMDFTELPGGCGVPLWDDQMSAWWRRIQISETKPPDEHAHSIGALEFLELTDRARAKVRSEPLSLRSVDKLVRANVNDPRYDPEVSVALFEHLLPRDIKDGLSESSDLVLVVDPKAARYPWEMLAQRSRDGLEPIANRLGIIRQLKTRRYRRRVVPAQGRDVLVIGDPQSPYVELPGAQQEAVRVANKLKNAPEFDVNLSLMENGTDIECALFAKEYRIMHIAAHGHYDQSQPANSGVIIGEDHFLNTITIGKLGAVPELVFLNCCHLAKMDVETKPVELAPEHYGVFAASVSTRLIQMGVRCVVAAGWAVDDAAAATFAETFYDQLLAGEAFGEAVRRARQEAYRRHQDREINTWVAYQCYGDPGFVLAQRTKKTSRTRATDWEVANELEEIVSEAEAADDPMQRRLKDRLREIEQSPIKFDGNACYLLGKAYGDLKVWRPAVRYCRRALLSFKSDAPICVIEQLANFEVRLADEIQGSSAAADPGQPEEFSPEQLREAAEGRLDLLLQIGETPERLSLLGSHYKRKAKLPQKAADRTKTLALGAKYYEQAAELHRKSTGRTDYYPAVNAVLLGFLKGGAVKQATRKKWEQALKDSQQAAAAEYALKPNFWNRVTDADIQLALALIEGKIMEQATALCDAYRQAFSEIGTAREHSSVLEHLDFIIQILAPKSSQAKTVAALTSIRDQLKTTIEAS